MGRLHPRRLSAHGQGNNGIAARRLLMPVMVALPCPRHDNGRDGFEAASPVRSFRAI